MRPRTVILTLELRDCRETLSDLRRTRHAALADREYGETEICVLVAHATATVAQSSVGLAKAKRARIRRQDRAILQRDIDIAMRLEGGQPAERSPVT